MNPKNSSKVSALLSLIFCLCSGLPESSVRLVKYFGLGRLGLWLRLRVEASVRVSLLGGRWRAARGQSQSLIAGMVALFVGVIFVAYVIAPALTQYFGVATSTWSSGTAALWGTIGLFTTLVIILLFIRTTGMM